jgi:hypothetical protein
VRPPVVARLHFIEPAVKTRSTGSSRCPALRTGQFPKEYPLREFLGTHAGKATAGVCLSALIFAWPPVASWLVGSLTLAFAVGHFRQSFRTLGEAGDPAASLPATPPPATRTAPATPAGGESRECDINAVMAALAASSKSH